MKKLVLSALVIMVAAFGIVAQTRYRTYRNDRFAYSIEFPSSLLNQQAPPANNDGRTFRSKDGKIEMLVWGQHNALGRTLVEQYDDSLGKCGDGEIYKVLDDKFFVISCTVNGRIFYQRTLHRGAAGPDIFFTFTIEYPRDQKKKMDPVVKRISRSFRFDPDADI